MPCAPLPTTGPANGDPVAEATVITNLRVTGQLPTALTGQLMWVGPDLIEADTSLADSGGGIATVHALALDAGRATSYRTRRIMADTATEPVKPKSDPGRVNHGVGLTNLIAFGKSILAFSEGTVAYEVDTARGTVRPVDLAGAHRSLVARPTVDACTGELHLLTASLPSQLHVVVSRGALTRTVRSIDDAPSRIRQLALTRDDVLLMAEGSVGVAARAGAELKPIWFPIDTDERHIAGAYAHAEAIVVYTTGPSLVRWTLERRTSTLRSQLLDATPHTSATSNNWHPGPPQRFLWTVGSGAAHKHDLCGGERRSHDFGDGPTPAELTFVADPDRSDCQDGGWLVGLVDDDSGDHAELIVLDAEAIERPAAAEVRIPRRIPSGTRGTWIPANRPLTYTENPEHGGQR